MINSHKKNTRILWKEPVYTGTASNPQPAGTVILAGKVVKELPPANQELVIFLAQGAYAEEYVGQKLSRSDDFLSKHAAKAA